MKKLFLALLLTGCSLAGATYGEPITLEVEDSVTFDDGLTVKLLEMSDSRCPADVQCIWEGELSGNFELSGVVETQEVRLGTASGSDALIENYRLALNEATETSATLTVVQVEDAN